MKDSEDKMDTYFLEIHIITAYLVGYAYHEY